MTDHLCLHQFDKLCKLRAINNRKRKLCEFAETCMENLGKSLWGTYFLAGFRHLEPLCTITEASVIEAAAAANEAKTTAVESASLVALLA